MVEIAIAHTSTRDVRHRIVAGQLDHAFIAREHAIGREGERLENRFLTQTGKDRGCRTTFMVAALCTNMVEGSAIRDLDLHALVEPRRGWAVFQKGQFSPGINLHNMVEDRIGNL